MSIIHCEENSIRGRKARMVELAGMLKEKKQGTFRSLEGILVRFCVKEGVKMDTARDYLNCFKGVGLIRIRSGKKSWFYNEDVEQELFGVNI